ncbi:MAG: hypothetical protein DRJ56_02065 [Thermoprotei archaeon]|nr:MAG: hypothetical protein DRJ56_02065 [Thermoprotei archaeon]
MGRIIINFCFLLTITSFLSLPLHQLAASSGEKLVTKVTLIRFADIAWVRVAASFPEQLVATRRYNITLDIKLIEVDGKLKKLLIKGIRVSIGSEYIEYVPDEPLSLTKVGDSRRVNVTIAPRFFASEMSPGDVRDATLKVDFSYHLEGTRAGGEEVIESGLYAVFASLPVRVVTPKTRVYVQPRVVTTYEPSYIVNFTVRVWVEGEGFVENVRVEVRGAPVQCYLLTTGRLEVGESRVLWTIMNVTELGPMAPERCRPSVLVTAVTPWGYVFSYTFSFTLELLKVRRVSAQVPDKVIALAYTPVKLSLEPAPEAKEEVTVLVSCDGRRLREVRYRPTIHVPLAPSPGLHEVRLTAYSKLQAPTSVTKVVEAVTVAPQLRVAAIEATESVRVEVLPLCAGSEVVVTVTSSEGGTVMEARLTDEQMSVAPATINGIEAAKGVAYVSLRGLGPGEYVIKVTYESGLGSVTRTLTYVVRRASPLEQLERFLSIIPLPTPMLLGVIAAAVAIPVAYAVLSRRRAEEVEEGE